MAGKKPLNKGLEALLGDVKKTPTTKKPTKVTKTETTNEAPITKITENQYQPRTFFDDEKLEDLASSIKEHGIIQPLVVRETTKGYELIAGERRLRAAKIAGLKKVPISITKASNTKSLEIAILENVQREDLDAIEVAKGYQRLKEEFSYTQEALSKSIGKPRSSVANSLRLLTLSEKIQKEISSGNISEGHAKVLLGLETIKAEALAEKIVKENLSVRALENLLKEKPTKTTNKEKTRDEINLESALSSKLGSKVTIDDKKGKGKLTIKYYSYDELDGIIEKISI
jgi:ParB family chromosome partitioning protein